MLDHGGESEDGPDNHDGQARGGAVEDDAMRLPAMRLFVRKLPGARRPLELLRLDSWGNTLLGTKLRGELATGYAILLAVCVFELCAWTLLFNYIFQGAQFAANGWTIAAVGLGLLWGIGIFTIDKNLIVSDLLRPGLGKLAGAAARIVLVLGSAYLTAQPIEQLMFRPMIDERLKEEMLREQAVAYVERLHELQAQREAIAAQKPDDQISTRLSKAVDTQRDAVEKLSKDLAAARTRAGQADRDKQRAYKARNDAEARWNRERGIDPRSPASDRAEKRFWQEQRSFRDASAAFDSISSEAEVLRKTLEDRDRRLKEVNVEYDQAHHDVLQDKRGEDQKLVADEKGYKQFLNELRTATYGDRVVREDGHAIRWKSADAMQRAIVLARLRDGEPPRWPVKDRTTLEEAARRFGLPTDFSATAVRDEAFGLWLLVLLLAAALPSLSVFYKLTTSRELKMYYSVAHQAAAGNPDAVVLLRADRRGTRESTR